MATKMRKKKLMVFGMRRMLVGIFLVLQLAFMLLFAVSTSRTSKTISVLLEIISIAASLYIVSRHDKGAYKTIWVYMILLFPVFGGLVYLFFSYQSTKYLFSRELLRIDSETSPHLFGDERSAAAQAAFPERKNQIEYLEKAGGFPVYDGTDVKYYPSGKEFYVDMLCELEKAQKYIFLEYFIIGEGKMWGGILDVLERKAREGVKVRLLYDDMGCLFLLPKDYPARMAKLGIECCAFNKFRPFLSTLQNNRDHRKICSVDGRVAFTGGINLADEYINEVERFGHWKDTGVKLTGNAAKSLTVIFLRMWLSVTKKKGGRDEDISEYLPCDSGVEAQGFVQPYADSPIDDEHIGENVYLQLINNAEKYLYICTPYLIIDDGMITALTLAAKSGVDVRIVTPHVWDKRVVHMATRSYYEDLIGAGVKIYEYTPGFIHAKVFVSDDTVASVGTTNLDFRSLYLHFECGTLLYGTPAISDIRRDLEETIAKSREISAADCKSNIFVRAFRGVLKLIAPIL